MPLDREGLEYFKTLRIADAPDLGPRLYEFLNRMCGGVNNVEQQTNSNVNGPPEAPPPPDAVTASGQDGRIQIAISHQAAEFYRGNHYFVEHADNPNFANPQVVNLGPSRNGSIYVGNQPRYIRTYNQYPGSAPSTPVYLGSAAQPRAVSGGGGGPAIRFLPSQGSGTGKPGQGMSGFGNVAFRSSNGKPPIR